MGGGGGAIQQLLQCNAVCMDSYGPCDEKKGTNVFAVSISLYPFPFFFLALPHLWVAKEKRSIAQGASPPNPKSQINSQSTQKPFCFCR
jgi:hypothetical protein